MTSAEKQRPRPLAPAGTPVARRSGGLRLASLHLNSRQVRTALIALLGCAVVMRIALQVHWVQGSGNLAQEVPVLIEGAAAAIIAITTRNPFGELENSAGRWLPYLRLGTALGMTAVAFGLLAASSASAALPGGELAILRNVGGMAGTGLITATLVSGALAWVGPLAYSALAELAVTAAWRSPWTWPARPAHDRGAALCAALVFAIGIVLITIRGTRNTASE